MYHAKKCGSVLRQRIVLIATGVIVLGLLAQLQSAKQQLQSARDDLSRPYPYVNNSTRQDFVEGRIDEAKLRETNERNYSLVREKYVNASDVSKKDFLSGTIDERKLRESHERNDKEVEEAERFHRIALVANRYYCARNDRDFVEGKIDEDAVREDHELHYTERDGRRHTVGTQFPYASPVMQRKYIDGEVGIDELEQDDSDRCSAFRWKHPNIHPMPMFRFTSEASITQMLKEWKENGSPRPPSSHHVSHGGHILPISIAPAAKPLDESDCD